MIINEYFHVAATTNLDGTETHGLFSELNKGFSQGGSIYGILINIGTAVGKSVKMTLTPKGGKEVTIWELTSLAAAIDSASLTDINISFGPYTIVRVYTTGVTGVQAEATIYARGL